MTLGFHRAGFCCVAAVELDTAARLSHMANFAAFERPFRYRAYSDIRTTLATDVARDLVDNSTSTLTSGADIVIGGPPCQAFSRLGRAALWDIAGQRHAHAQDERATMYAHFLEYVDVLRPLAFVMENVREIGKFAGRNIAEEIAITAEGLGYSARYALLNAAWYGVPQFRERMFIIGIRKELGLIPAFPPRTHHCALPVGYSTSRAGSGRPEVLSPHDHYVDHAELARHLRPAVTAAEAFQDLPPITEHLDGRAGKGVPRDVRHRTAYGDQNSAYTRLMKAWPGFTSRGMFTGHVIRFTPRDYETFRRMPHGGMYPEALATAQAIFAERVHAEEARTGRPIVEGSDEWVRLFKATVPPYKADRYPNKFRKMWPDQPVRTIPAHLGKDSYSHIHFDSEQARCISLREAARLQSFPDAFQLCGSMNEQLTQIGNAVPPLLAYAVARTLRSQLEAAAPWL